MGPTQDAGTQASGKRNQALSLPNEEEDIIEAYKRIDKVKPNGNSVTGFCYTDKQKDVAWVKFGPLKQIAAEVRNHRYAFGALKKMPPNQTQGIRIPEIYHTFNIGEEPRKKMFIVMECMHGKTLKELVETHGNDSTKKTHAKDIARAIRLLMTIEPPPPTPDFKQGPGPVGGGRIRHPLFKKETSYLPYPSVDALEEYLNKVCNEQPDMTLWRTRFYVY